MIATNIGPTTSRCCLRIVDDIRDETRIIELDRDPNNVLTDILLMRKKLRKLQKVFDCCVHVSRAMITIHWFSGDKNFAISILDVAEVPRDVLECLQRGEVWK